MPFYVTTCVKTILFISFFLFAVLHAAEAEDSTVRIYGSPPTYYNAIQEAYNAAQEGDLIQAMAVEARRPQYLPSSMCPSIIPIMTKSKFCIRKVIQPDAVLNL